VQLDLGVEHSDECVQVPLVERPNEFSN
jgi:hypothetical protein